jgi:hypothetical protein
MRNISKLILAVLALTCLAGCKTMPPPVDPTADQQARSYVAAVKALPMGQRAAYAQAHPEGVKALTDSKDGKLLIDYNVALRGGQ